MDCNLFDDLDGSLVILVQFHVYGTTTDFVKNIHGRKTNGAQGEVSCSSHGWQSGPGKSGMHHMLLIVLDLSLSHTDCGNEGEEEVRRRW